MSHCALGTRVHLLAVKAPAYVKRNVWEGVSLG